MAYKLVVTQSFSNDLNQIIAYLVTQHAAPQAAKKLMAEVDRLAALIQMMPTFNAVSRKPILKDLGYREQLVNNYVIVYAVEDDRVILVRIFHQRQDYERFF